MAEIVAVMNPCKGVCKLHPLHKVCKGCLRTRLEVAKWSRMDIFEKQKVLKHLIERREQLGEINA